MISRALDSNNDLIVDNGSFRTVAGGAEVIQQVRSRLLFYTGEWFLNLQSGTPYFQEIFKRPINLGRVESILKSRILDTEGVNELVSFEMNYTGESLRKLSVAFTANTIYGEISESEVTINA